MAKEILEIAFENVQLRKFTNFLINVKSDSNLLNYQVVPEYPLVIQFNSSDELFNIINSFSDGVFNCNFSDFKLGKYAIDKVSIQLLKDNLIYDASLYFEDEALKSMDSIKYFQHWAFKVAQVLGSKTYYCGLEPASDLETRFFTESIFGPLNFDV